MPSRAMATPPLTRRERELIRRLRSPAAVQAWLNALPYNTETGGETLRSTNGERMVLDSNACPTTRRSSASR